MAFTIQFQQLTHPLLQQRCQCKDLYKRHTGMVCSSRCLYAISHRTCGPTDITLKCIPFASKADLLAGTQRLGIPHQDQILLLQEPKFPALHNWNPRELNPMPKYRRISSNWTQRVAEADQNPRFASAQAHEPQASPAQRAASDGRSAAEEGGTTWSRMLRKRSGTAAAGPPPRAASWRPPISRRCSLAAELRAGASRRRFRPPAPAPAPPPSAPSPLRPRRRAVTRRRTRSCRLGPSIPASAAPSFFEPNPPRTGSAEEETARPRGGREAARVWEAGGGGSPGRAAGVGGGGDERGKRGLCSGRESGRERGCGEWGSRLCWRLGPRCTL